MTKGGEEFEAYQRAFDGRVESQRKSLIIILAPALALVLLAIIRPRADSARRPERYGEHLVFSLHLLAFVWLVLAGVGVVARLARGAFPSGGAGRMIVIGIVAILLAWGFAYLLRAMRRVYTLSRPVTIVLSAALAAAFTGLLIAYRGLLFFTTCYTL